MSLFKMVNGKRVDMKPKEEAEFKAFQERNRAEVQADHARQMAKKRKRVLKEQILDAIASGETPDSELVSEFKSL